MKSIRKLWIAALFIGLLGAGAAFQFYSHRASAEESSAGGKTPAAADESLPSCHLTDDGSPIVVPEQKK
ncbi:hypothetical protein LJK87_02530 [Paenibacillus sp. P25]|nr:hypothetical protein LJK87_02530 [Paenibacillus sp. P25]